jgi:16S rRNA (cytidine1402-2'-O)-methyltransferase
MTAQKPQTSAKQKLNPTQTSGSPQKMNTSGALYIVATPIGNSADITLRAIDVFRQCKIIIGEEHRPTSTLLKKIGIDQSEKEIYLLNEHSKPKDIDELLELCKTQKVALVSDCGTPVFSDPGSDLIRACRKNNIATITLPGASSLMSLISLSSQKLTQFVFFGFLPANKEDRSVKLKDLKAERRPWIIMDTPYRLQATLKELATELPNARALLAVNLTQENEHIFEGTFKEITAQCQLESGEFILLKY